jgi:hypothetical protein
MGFVSGEAAPSTEAYPWGLIGEQVKNPKTPCLGIDYPVFPFLFARIFSACEIPFAQRIHVADSAYIACCDWLWRWRCSGIQPFLIQKPLDISIQISKVAVLKGISLSVPWNPDPSLLGIFLNPVWRVI